MTALNIMSEKMKKARRRCRYKQLDQTSPEPHHHHHWESMKNDTDVNHQDDDGTDIYDDEITLRTRASTDVGYYDFLRVDEKMNKKDDKLKILDILEIRTLSLDNVQEASRDRLVGIIGHLISSSRHDRLQARRGAVHFHQDGEFTMLLREFIRRKQLKACDLI